MTEKSENLIVTHPEKCTGCLICQLICSFIYHKKYSLALANIQVSTHVFPPEISFRDECTHCFECVQHCLYGALQLEEAEA
ncbi:MAG: 4Fe-4S dicluster domain-containing protein [Candidatus Helarchaeota archaeon]